MASQNDAILYCTSKDLVQWSEPKVLAEADAKGIARYYQLTTEDGKKAESPLENYKEKCKEAYNIDFKQSDKIIKEEQKKSEVYLKNALDIKE